MTLKVPPFSELAPNLLVVGDVMLDRYWTGNASRISPEAPVPIVKVGDELQRPGGAGNVAVNLAALGCQTTLLGIIGQDEAGETLRKKLYEANISFKAEVLSNLPTITKLRILSQHQQLIRLDFEERLPSEKIQGLNKHFLEQLKMANAVILSDYGKGTLSNARYFIEQANARNIPTLVDPKGKQFDLYQGATLLTPNRKEFEMVMGVCANEMELVEKAKKAIDRYGLTGILITCGGDGMLLVTREPETHKLPAHAREVFDVTGAGDTVIAVMGASLAAGESLETAMMLANWAASIVVGKLGAATVSEVELRNTIFQNYYSPCGVVTEQELYGLVEQAKAHGEKIVMTNGCFDILHPGHIHYLEQAKALGDRLIVAVNDDGSVARLKGDSRPIHTLNDRMKILSVLEMVDWVVPFSEDTPERLISTVLPDVLVKGGDYQVNDVAGHKAVLANHGDVKILDFVDGYSTTTIIDKMKTSEDVI